MGISVLPNPRNYATGKSNLKFCLLAISILLLRKTTEIQHGYRRSFARVWVRPFGCHRFHFSLLLARNVISIIQICTAKIMIYLIVIKEHTKILLKTTPSFDFALDWWFAISTCKYCCRYYLDCWKSILLSWLLLWRTIQAFERNIFLHWSSDHVVYFNFFRTTLDRMFVVFYFVFY